MNVALPALVVFLLLLPGFVLRTRLKRAERTSLDYSPFGQVVAEAVLWALVAHVIWLAASDFLFGRVLEPKVLLSLLKMAKDESQLDRFYPVDGDYFVLRYTEAVTLNIQYLKLTQTTTSD